MLVDLVDSVKPGGKLKNTIAEVGIYVLNGKKKRGATRFVMPLYVTVSRALHFFLFPLALPGRKQQQHYIFLSQTPMQTLLQNNQTGMAAVTHAFQKDTNNLHHRQLVCAHLFSFLLQSRFSLFFQSSNLLWKKHTDILPYSAEVGSG